MNVLKYEKVYEENKKLDKVFIETYGNSDEIILKNQVELLVELGEFVNETKCFKYWSKKEANKELVLEEYADTLLMIFYFFRELNISLLDNFPKESNERINSLIIRLYNLCSKFHYEYTQNIIKEIFVNLLKVGELLNFTDDEIISACLKKINIDKERFKIDY